MVLEKKLNVDLGESEDIRGFFYDLLRFAKSFKIQET